LVFDRIYFLITFRQYIYLITNKCYFLCSKCDKKFPRVENNRPDYSGYDINSWTLRDLEQHKSQAQIIKNATTLSLRSELESSLGIRYSVLLKLPYFNPIRGHTVEPMHNLLLGTAKHVFCVWIQKEILNNEKLKQIDDHLSEISCPSEVGRITQSMTLFKTMKSDEGQNWVLYFSSFCLRGVIKKEHFNMWQVFVRACYLLINTSISTNEAELAHQLLLLFQQLLGADHCTPNMHMHLHLLSCNKDYGPIYGFWGYSFERYNGILGSYNTNNRAITITLMRKFLSRVSSLPSMDIFGLEDNTTLSKSNDLTAVDLLKRNVNLDISLITKTYHVCTVPSLVALSRQEVECIKDVLSQHEFETCVDRFVHSYLKIKFGRLLLRSNCYRGRDVENRDCVVLCKLNEQTLKPAIIEGIYVINISTEKGGNQRALNFLSLR